MVRKFEEKNSHKRSGMVIKKCQFLKIENGRIAHVLVSLVRMGTGHMYHYTS